MPFTLVGIFCLGAKNSMIILIKGDLKASLKGFKRSSSFDAPLRLCFHLRDLVMDPLLPLRALEGIQMSLDKAMCVGRDFTVSPTPPGLIARAHEVLGSFQGGIWSRTGHSKTLVD
ncbi:hypothetical protein Tco_0672137 [Tanacetum coccineum]